MKTLGICFGASTIQVVELTVDPDFTAISDVTRVVHEGNPREVFLSILKKYQDHEIDRVAVTGRAFRNQVSFSKISEPQAIEKALAESFSAEDSPALVLSAGGETQIAYKTTSAGRVDSVHTGNKCASGTGEFFLQQIRRMDISLAEAAHLAVESEPYAIAGRCSVFCKSDCTHALNKGIQKGKIIAGLCKMMADKLYSLVPVDRDAKVFLIGGGALNNALVSQLKKKYTNLITTETSSCLEAYGAALWAAKNSCTDFTSNTEKLFSHHDYTFSKHPPLKTALPLVTFHHASSTPLGNNESVILGLDVGSTTTKAVLLKEQDSTIAASVYLRTNGDPIGASKNCYRALKEQIKRNTINIRGIGITGSGRQLAALHALTDGVVNEIIAHATAAAFFDTEVDTILEIGGQDAKYTYLTNGIPSDYAMNEACSAGTGSFLEESAWESLGVKTEDIGEFALRGTQPPNFSDECAAFISSDVKLAGQEGLGRDDILGGLVYSICLNYLNRVKGTRRIGKKIFMQGGVCYNRAVPVAMAALLQTRIIVPPDPGLMGAFGVAIEIRNRIADGQMSPARFELDTLIAREARKEKEFICPGGTEKCDRKCPVSVFSVDGKKIPFGGSCDKYYNQRLNISVETASLDYVAKREKLLYEEFTPPAKADDKQYSQTVGLNRSFLTHSLYVLYSHFFSALGCRIVLSDPEDREGFSRVEAPFCLPGKYSHAAFLSLMKKDVDYIFLPQVMQIPVPNVPTFSRTCVFVQGEPYYLKSTFREEIESSPVTILSPILKMENGYEQAESEFINIALRLGYAANISRPAFHQACSRQRDFDAKLQELGSEALHFLANNPDKTGIVIFGRPYNAFASEANMGIPHKIASRNHITIPHDMLPANSFDVDKKMFWAMGQKILKAAAFVKNHPRLFGVYITNFSCGPDSFLLSYFRQLMNTKPSLTLELDEHTANAGIDTRIEAALDIMQFYTRESRVELENSTYQPASVIETDALYIKTSQGKTLPLTHKDVEVLIPPMGRYGPPSVAAILRGSGINAVALPDANMEILTEGRKNSLCKECLPYLVTTGSFLSHLNKKRAPEKVSLLFIPTGGGPCRLGQYCKSLENTIYRKKMENVAVLTVTDENGYGGLGLKVLFKAWQAMVAADVFDDMRSMLSICAVDKSYAHKELDRCWTELLAHFEGNLSMRFTTLLRVISKRLKKIPLKKTPETVPVISLIGEYYVRKELFSRMNIIDFLEERGFMVRVAPSIEYPLYSNYNCSRGLQEGTFTQGQKIKMKIQAQIQEFWEWRIKTILATSGLYHAEMVEVEKTIQGIDHLINHNFRGEAILTVGSGMREILTDACGIISIGPFGCMPSRMAESMLKKELTLAGKKRMKGEEGNVTSFKMFDNFPFLSIETDGKPFPQITIANLEAFVLQAQRLHTVMLQNKKARKMSFMEKLLPQVTRLLC